MKNLELSDNALKILESRYLRRNQDLKIMETPLELFVRVARHVAQAELDCGTAAGVDHRQGVFFDMLVSGDFLPNSPTRMNAGMFLGQLSACFVIPVADTIKQIFETLKEMVLVHPSGGGTGFSFSRLQPKNSPVRSTGGEAAGPIAFMKIFDCATGHIKQAANGGGPIWVCCGWIIQTFWTSSGPRSKYFQRLQLRKILLFESPNTGLHRQQAGQGGAGRHRQ